MSIWTDFFFYIVNIKSSVRCYKHIFFCKNRAFRMTVCQSLQLHWLWTRRIQSISRKNSPCIDELEILFEIWLILYALKFSAISTMAFYLIVSGGAELFIAMIADEANDLSKRIYVYASSIITHGKASVFFCRNTYI